MMVFPTSHFDHVVLKNQNQSQASEVLAEVLAVEGALENAVVMETENCENALEVIPTIKTALTADGLTQRKTTGVVNFLLTLFFFPKNISG